MFSQINATFKYFRANVALERLDVTNTVYRRQVSFQIFLACQAFKTNATLKLLHVTDTVYRRQVLFQVSFRLKLFAQMSHGNVTNTVHCNQVPLQCAFFFKALETVVTMEITDVTDTVNSFQVQSQGV